MSRRTKRSMTLFNRMRTDQKTYFENKMPRQVLDLVKKKKEMNT